MNNSCPGPRKHQHFLKLQMKIVAKDPLIISVHCYTILEMSSFCSIFYTVEVPTRWLMDPLFNSQTKINFLPPFHPVTWGPTAPWRWSRLGFGVQGSGLSPAPRSGSLRERWNNGNFGGRPFFTRFDLGAFWKQSLVIVGFPHEELYQKVPHQAVQEKAWTTEGQFQKGKSCCAEKEAWWFLHSVMPSAISPFVQTHSKSLQDFPSWLEFVQQYFWIYNVFFTWWQGIETDSASKIPND